MHTYIWSLFCNGKQCLLDLLSLKQSLWKTNGAFNAQQNYEGNHTHLFLWSAQGIPICKVSSQGRNTCKPLWHGYVYHFESSAYKYLSCYLFYFCKEDCMVVAGETEWKIHKTTCYIPNSPVYALIVITIIATIHSHFDKCQ